jgi:hypothetical protein
MQDFAYLFSDSAAAWLRGRGDARFRHYERYYRADRLAAQGAGSFDLQRSNEQYALRCRRKGGFLGAVLDSRAFNYLMSFLAILWGGSLLLLTVGKSQPVAAGVVLSGLFIVMRMKRWQGRFRGR